MTGQWLTGADGSRWFFDSGALSLDFGYTGDYGYGVPAWEHLREPADLVCWLAARFAVEAPDEGEASELFARAVRLRAGIARIARALTEGEQQLPADIDAINTVAVGSGVPQLLPGGTWTPPAPGADAMLATIAQDAVAVFSAGTRVRQCAADDCRLIFFDASRPGTRRWCSMQRCGNRAKTRAHYARHHE